MRKRMIDPDIWQDEKMSKLDFVGRLVFIGLITQANDYGKLRGNCTLLKNTIFPYDTKIKTIEKHINQLADFGMITLYEVNGEKFIKLTNWDKYQKLEHPSKDSIPDPSHETITKVSRDFPAQVKLSQVKLSKDKEKDSSEPQKEVATEPPISNNKTVLVYPITGKDIKEWVLTEKEFNEYTEVFPGVNVLQECKNALQWCRANPTKRKTSRGMSAFLTRWLTKEQNRGGRNFGTDKNKYDHLV